MGEGTESMPPFDLRLPLAPQSTSVVFASPHSGRCYPPEFLAASCLDPLTLRSSEDAFVDLLFSQATDFGAPFLMANLPRAYVDLNRACGELDPALIEVPMRAPTNPRIASGLGVIPRVVANGRAIYRGKLTMREAERRLREVWHPYHGTLQRVMRETHLQFGEAILIDCHSMPHEAIEAFVRSGAPRPDVVLGDRFGSSAAPTVLAMVERAFSAHGFRVSRNAPFSGAYITQSYGRPGRAQHAIQVELDRALYMNEQTLEPLPGFESLRARLRLVIAEITAIGRYGAVPLAAE